MVKSIPPEEFAETYPILQNSNVGECPHAYINNDKLCVCTKNIDLCYNCIDCPMKKQLSLSEEDIEKREGYWNTELLFGVYANWTLRQLYQHKLKFLRGDLIKRDYLYGRLYESLKRLSFEIINACTPKSNILIKGE